jgi:hypothetical protein
MAGTLKALADLLNVFVKGTIMVIRIAVQYQYSHIPQLAIVSL